MTLLFDAILDDRRVCASFHPITVESVVSANFIKAHHVRSDAEGRYLFRLFVNVSDVPSKPNYFECWNLVFEVADQLEDAEIVLGLEWFKLFYNEFERRPVEGMITLDAHPEHKDLLPLIGVHLCGMRYIYGLTCDSTTSKFLFKTMDPRFKFALQAFVLRPFISNLGDASRSTCSPFNVQEIRHRQQMTTDVPFPFAPFSDYREAHLCHIRYGRTRSLILCVAQLPLVSESPDADHFLPLPSALMQGGAAHTSSSTGVCLISWWGLKLPKPATYLLFAASLDAVENGIIATIRGTKCSPQLDQDIGDLRGLFEELPFRLEGYLSLYQGKRSTSRSRSNHQTHTQWSIQKQLRQNSSTYRLDNVRGRPAREAQLTSAIKRVASNVRNYFRQEIRDSVMGSTSQSLTSSTIEATMRYRIGNVTKQAEQSYIIYKRRFAYENKALLVTDEPEEDVNDDEGPQTAVGSKAEAHDEYQGRKNGKWR
ncbi:hypothetical protein CVT26_007220 [Gymnopilus dilepis]|uniref:Uncharacterized protein n=1 Tax=Gymnopilus dilepis TaxID=231916 RepID=A0A409WQB3_9AGAR|nr:hypothetical protein CVT26_007220 [Gymnopilus dilepis]